MSYIKIIITSLFLILASCSNNKEKISENVMQNEDMEAEMIKAYNEGLKALELGDVAFASKKFNEAELLFPQSEWAPKSSLMSAYAFWSQSYYQSAVEELERFIKLYPTHQNLDYAYYLLAMCHYDSIVDEKKDLKPLLNSQKFFRLIQENYPNTDYAVDAKYKLELIRDFLAAKELYVARHYMKKKMDCCNKQIKEYYK